jgi:preprotein translocase subunit SecG
MFTVVIVIHLIVAIALVGVIMIQRSEGGALGVGGGMSGFMTGRGTANLLTRATAILAALFIVTSLTLAKLSGLEREPASILDRPPATETAPAPQPAEPTAPLAR